jgi:hypothetical protein
VVVVEEAGVVVGGALVVAGTGTAVVGEIEGTVVAGGTAVFAVVVEGGAAASPDPSPDKITPKTAP